MTAPGLNTQFAALHEERVRTWPAEQLRKNVEQRAALVAAYDPKSHAKIGDRLDNIALENVAGDVLSSADLVQQGPALLIFFRFSGCPACNIALPYYHEQLTPRLRAIGIPIFAISPQHPVDQAFQEKFGPGFTILSDRDNALGRALGITFEPNPKPVVQPGEDWLGAKIGTNSWELPQPTVILLNQDATIRFIEVSPDWLARPEADAILAALPEVNATIN